VSLSTLHPGRGIVEGRNADAAFCVTAFTFAVPRRPHSHIAVDGGRDFQERMPYGLLCRTNTAKALAEHKPTENRDGAAADAATPKSEREPEKTGTGGGGEAGRRRDFLATVPGDPGRRRCGSLLALLSPEIPKAIRRKFGVTNRVLNI